MFKKILTLSSTTLLISTLFVYGGAGNAQITTEINSSSPEMTQNGTNELSGTSWRLVQFQGGDDTILLPDDKTKYTLTFNADGTVNARIDCNQGQSTWESSGTNQLQFGTLAITMAMCPPISLHDLIVRDWEYVRSYVLKDGHLFLSLMADGGIYEFEPIPYMADTQISSSTRIRFAPGRECGYYRGEIVGKKTFVLTIVPYDEQLLYVYSTKGAQLSNLSVRGTQGIIPGQNAANYGITETATVYPINQKGDYSISLSSETSSNSIAFCVIDNPHGEKP
jgi:heat shock protein HslJ